jgi:hypothetical protein
MVNPFTRALPKIPTAADIARRVTAGVSPSYRGDYTWALNQLADIPAEQNCSVWVTNVPPNVTTNMLLGVIVETGRVWASVISPPTRKFGTAAAKITFFTPGAALKFLRRANSPRGFVVDSLRARAVPDRNPVAEPSDLEDHSRVISIRGSKDLINEELLTAYFAQRFQYQIDEVVTLVRGKCINVLESRFGSYRCQAQWAFANLQADERFVSQDVWVKFRRDLCHSWEPQGFLTSVVCLEWGRTTRSSLGGGGDELAL